MFDSQTRVVLCSFAPVGLEDYVDYMREHFSDFTYIRWRFPHSRDAKSISYVEDFRAGESVSRKKLFHLPTLAWCPFYFLLLPVNYLVYFLQSLRFGFLQAGRRRTLFMGINYFCTFCGIVLRVFGKVDYVIYRVMDFFPLPRQGVYRYLNRVFFLFDRFCLKYSDEVWFTTEGHILGREKYGYFDRRKATYKMIPLGIDTAKCVSLPLSDVTPHSLIYCGNVSRYHMLDLVFSVVCDLKACFPDVCLNVVGTGPDEVFFRDLAQKMGLSDNVLFHGFMEDGDAFVNLMSRNSLGLAIYRDEENFMKYTEPAKIKHYMMYGVPAVVSRVPMIATALADKRVCLAVNNSKDEIVKTIREYFDQEAMQVEFRKNVCDYIQTVDVTTMLDDRLLGVMLEQQE